MFSLIFISRLFFVFCSINEIVSPEKSECFNFNRSEILKPQFIPIIVKNAILDFLSSLFRIFRDLFKVEPKSTNRETIEDNASRAFPLYWKKLKRPYSRTMTHFRKTYATRERIFNNSSTTTLHSNVKITEKYYIDDKEIVKQMVKDGFRVFPKKKKEKESNEQQISLR